MSVPFQMVIKKSAVRGFAISIAIALIYQYLLSCHELNVYLFSLERDSIAAQNKEGIFSTIGYLSLYLGGEAICLGLNQILSDKRYQRYKRIEFKQKYIYF